MHVRFQFKRFVCVLERQATVKAKTNMEAAGSKWRLLIGGTGVHVVGDPQHAWSNQGSQQKLRKLCCGDEGGPPQVVA